MAVIGALSRIPQYDTLAHSSTLWAVVIFLTTCPSPWFQTVTIDNRLRGYAGFNGHLFFYGVLSFQVL